MARKDKVAIWLVVDKDICYDPKTGSAVPLYVYVSSNDPTAYPPEVVVERDGKYATLEELVELCDQDAESINAHDFVGAHRLLGAVLYRNLGREQATKVMLDIAERRGLHGMNGICGTYDSYEDLGVGENGDGWDGEYGD